MQSLILAAPFLNPFLQFRPPEAKAKVFRELSQVVLFIAFLRHTSAVSHTPLKNLSLTVGYPEDDKAQRANRIVESGVWRLSGLKTSLFQKAEFADEELRGF